MGERIFNHTAHKALWDWLSKNPEKQKWDWPEWEENGGLYPIATNFCFACNYSLVGYDDLFDAKELCKCCPLEWPGADLKNIEPDSSPCEDSIYGRWRKKHDYSKSYAEASMLSEQIRDLPIRNGVKCV